MKHHATSCNNGHRHVLASMIRTYHSHSRITTFHHVIHSYMPIHNKTLLTCRSCSMQKRDESREDFAFVESGGTLRRELPALLGHGWCSGGFSHCDNLACPESCVTFCNPCPLPVPSCPPMLWLFRILRLGTLVRQSMSVQLQHGGIAVKRCEAKSGREERFQLLFHRCLHPMWR